MQIADILRKIADIADQQQDPGRPDDKIQNPAALGPIKTGLAVDNPDNTDQAVDDKDMVPPLQLKLELLKRAVGVDNVYDNERADETHDAADSGTDELDIIKKNAGIAPQAVVISAAGDDDPFDD
jgi:hypothetical protein